VAIIRALPGVQSNDIMETLKKGSLFSDILQENWRRQLGQYSIVSFYEGKGNVSKLLYNERLVGPVSFHFLVH
jgi:hypothetical protein